jgi:hypothetical protein
MTSELRSEETAPAEEHAVRTSGIVGGAALLAGVAVGVGMGMKMRGGVNRLERRVEDYRAAWSALRRR